MNPNEEEILDLNILRVLDSNRTRWGLRPEDIRVLLTKFGSHGMSLETVNERVDYLTQKGKCEEVLKEINKTNRTWRITTAGIEHVDKHT